MVLARNAVAMWHELSKMNEINVCLEQNNIVTTPQMLDQIGGRNLRPLKALFVKKGRKFLKSQIGILNMVLTMFDSRSDDIFV